ncbi:hypothetical protein BH09SUM1_BH09SUM1_01990 [soil metagenome]
MSVNRKRGFSLVEVVVAAAILIIGIVGIMQLFPKSIQASNQSALRAEAALLAQRKVEELRRDEQQSGVIIDSIKALPAPTELIPFPEDDRLAYQFYSKSLLASTDTPGEVEDDFGVARVIIRYNPAFRPKSEVLYELRFDQ